MKNLKSILQSFAEAYEVPINPKCAFVGVGKLGKDVAEVISEYYDIVGYDIRKIENTTIKMEYDLKTAVSNKDIVFIAVPTAHDKSYDGRYPTSHLPPKDFDYSVVVSVTKEVDSYVNNNTLIVMISTMLPGTVRREIAPVINNGRFIYNPYLIAQGSVKWDMQNPEMVMIGTENGEETEDVELLMEFYRPILKKHGTRFEIGTWEEVESMKIFYNTFITTKLCLVNMIQDTAMAIGHMNVDRVTDALKHSKDRITGPKYMTAGLGDGGGCHPRDNIALRSFAEKHNLGYDLFNAIMKTREEQARNMAKFFETINVPKSMPVIILGTGFKPNVNQLEGSPSILVGHYIELLGYNVYYDQEVLDTTSPKVYFLGWPVYFNNYLFVKGSIIIDPWRQIKSIDKNELTIYHYGNTRNNSLGLVES